MENGGQKESKTYYVQGFKAKKPIRVFCDMENEGGGWTLFLNYHY